MNDKILAEFEIARFAWAAVFVGFVRIARSWSYAIVRLTFLFHASPYDGAALFKSVSICQTLELLIGAANIVIGLGIIIFHHRWLTQLLLVEVIALLVFTTEAWIEVVFRLTTRNATFGDASSVLSYYAMLLIFPVTTILLLAGRSSLRK